VAPPPTPKLLTSRVLEGLLIHRVQPEYPRLAQIVHIEGTVELRAVIGKDGEVESLRVVSGHPYLAQAAVAAVRQWRYRPFLLNGVPIEVEAQILVNFRLHS
jgi:protein TonB